MNSTSRLRSMPLGRSALTIVIAVALLLLAGATSRADAAPPFEVEIVTGIDYDGSPGTALDLYVPDVPGRAKRPLVMWTNGCAWLFTCGRSGTPGIAAVFNPQGYAVAGVSVAGTTTLFGGTPFRFPAQLHDIRTAVRFLRANAAAYNLDPDRFAIMGFSSGGWTSAIAGTTSDEAQLPGEPNTNGLSSGVSSAVQAVVGFSSPTDFLRMNQWYVDNPGVPSAIDHDAPLAPLPPPWFFPAASPESLLVGCTSGANLLGIQSCPAATRRANPISYVEGSEVPMLLLHGAVDPLVPPGQSELLYEALAAAGNEALLVSVAGAGHSPDAIRAGEEVTVRHTNRGGPETVSDGPTPTWETIEDFIHVQLSRARGR